MFLSLFHYFEEHFIINILKEWTQIMSKLQKKSSVLTVLRTRMFCFIMSFDNIVMPCT